MKSIGQKIQELTDFSAMNSARVTIWEFDFINSMESRSENGKKTTHLSEKQVAVIDKLYARLIGE